MNELWTIRIYFDGESADPAVYPLKSCSIPRCVGAAGTHAQQKATVSISGPTVSLSLKLVGRKEQTKAEIYCGSAIQFTGLIDTDWDFDAKGRLIESVSLTVMDYSGKFKIGVFGEDIAPENARLVRGPQRWQNYAVCDPSNQDTSIVHQILKLATGFLGITIPVKCDTTCTTRLDYFQLEQDSDLKTQLEQLLKEFRLDYIFDADNSIRIISTDSNGEPVATVTDFRNSLRGSGSVYKPKSIKATWRQYERRVGEKIGEGYHKSDSVNSRSVEYGQDVNWSLSDGASLDDWEIVSIENLNPGSTWTKTGVTHPRIDGASAKVTSYDLDGCHIVMERHGACAKGYIRARITADIVIRYNKTQELYSNPGTTQESLTLLHHHQLSSSDGIEGATEYAMYYEAMKRRAATTYTFSSLSEYAPGAIVTLSESSVTGISTKARIIEQTLDPLTGIYKYKAEGAGDLDLKDAITKAETSEEHPIYGGDFLELSADLDESTGVVTVVAEGDAVDYYGLTPAWDLNGTSVTATGPSVAFPVRDLALSGNVVTCTATLDGETVTATYDIDQLLSAPTLAIFTGDGSLFSVGAVNATLSAVLMRSGVDVALANESIFTWTRTSTDTAADKTWNASSKATGKRSVIITDSDLVDGKAVFTVSCVVGSTTYTSAGFSIVAVSDGANGWSNATCQLFKRSATAPPAYDGKQLTYTFATATLVGDTGSWSRTIPSGADPLYVIYASAFAAADTDIVETTDWTAPAILSENGTVGQSGMSVKTVLLYQRSETAPALPTGQVTYSFDSGEISGQGAWSLDVPTTNGYPLWVTSATAASRSASDIIEPSEWSTPVIMAQDGAKGDKGDTGPQGAKGDTGPKGATGATGAQGPQGEKGDTGAQGPQGIQGKTGNGINSVTVTYGVSASASTKPSTWSTDIPSVTAGQYLWTRTITDYTDDSVADTVTYTYALQGKTGATGPKGETGSTGASGTSVTVSSIRYQAGASATTAPTGTWSDNPVSVSQGQYLWTKTTFSDGKVAYGIARQGADGAKGDTGAQGATGEQGPQGEQGVSVTGIVEEYALSTSNTSVTGTWGTAVPTLTATNKYLWNRSKTTYSDGTSSGYTTALIIGVYGDKGETGATGPQGEKGETGAQGPTGATGATGRGISGITEYYLASASSTAPSASDTGWSTSAQTPTTAKPYLWNKTVVTYTSGSPTSTIAMIGQSIKGDTGATGSQGAAGPKGDPATTYVTLNTGDDLNNCFAKDTIYVSPSTAVCASLLHKPDGFIAGEVRVETAWCGGDTYVVQTLYCKQGTNHKVFSRTKSYSSFSAWQELGAKGEKGDKGAAAKDFTLYQSSTFFEVSPRGVTHKMQVISITCVPLNITSPTITWSVSSAVPTQAISSDKTVLSLTVQSGVALSDMTVACAVSGIGTKSITILSTPTGENGPLYLGTDWDESATTTSEGDPLESGDYYLRLSDTMVRVYSGTEWRDVSAATSTHQMMQDALSDVLKHGADVKQSSSVLYAYVGNLVAQSASIKALSTEVITSANYAEDSSGLPVAGYKLDGPNNLIKSYGMLGYNSQFHDISIKGGHITINDESQNPVFVTNEADQGTEINATGDAPAYYDIDEFLEGLSKNSLKDATISASKDGITFSYDGYYINDTDGTVNVQAVPSDSSYTWTQSITMTVTKENSDGTKNAFGTASYSGKNTVNLLYIMSENTGKLTVSIKNSAGTEICRVTRTARNGYSFSNYFSQGDVETETGLNPASASGNFTYNFTFEMTNIYGLGAVGSTFGVKFECEMHAAYSNTLGAKRIGFVSRSYTNTGILYHGYYGYFPLGKKYLGTSAPITIGTRETSNYLNYGLASSFIRKLAAGTYQVNADKAMLYQDGKTSRSRMSVVAVTAAYLDITSTQGNVRYASTDYIEGIPKIRFTPVSTLKGATVLNLNAATDTSQIGTAVQEFANVWANNINNVAVTDSNNQSLSVDGASSIVGAVNKINRDLTKKAGFTFKHRIIRGWGNGTGGSEVTYDCIASNYLPSDTSRQYVVIGEMSGYDKNGKRANIQSDVMRTATGIHSNSSSGDYPNPNGCYSQSGNDSHRQFAITFVMPVERYIYYASWTSYLMITLFGYFVF